MQQKPKGFIKRNLNSDNVISSVLIFLLTEVILVVMIKPTGTIWTILLVIATSVVAIPVSFLAAIGIKFSCQSFNKPDP